MTPTPENRRESRQRNRHEASAQSAPESARPRFAPLWVIALAGLGGIAIAGAVVFEMQRGKPPVADGSTAPISMPVAPTPAPGAPTITPAMTPMSAPATQPPGEAPPGKVWNAEHGHYHDAPPTAAPGAPAMTPTLAPPGASATPPPGEAPPGKVWNAEHGHWHDAPPKPQ